MTSPSNQPSIDDLTTEITQFTQSGAPDLQVSPAAHAQYTALIQAYRNALADQRAQAVSLADYHEVGGLVSANSLRSQLINAVTDPVNGVLATIDKYTAFLDEHQKMADTASNRFHAEDQSS
jgi:hypothetical protein